MLTQFKVGRHFKNGGRLELNVLSFFSLGSLHGTLLYSFLARFSAKVGLFVHASCLQKQNGGEKGESVKNCLTDHVRQVATQWHRVMEFMGQL